MPYNQIFQVLMKGGQDSERPNIWVHLARNNAIMLNEPPKVTGHNVMTNVSQPEDMPEAFQTAWNVHDMQAFGSLFTEDATFVNRFGHYVRGINEILALHTPIHETIYQDSMLSNQLIDIDHISDDVAIIHFWSRLSAGEAHPAGPHELDTLILAVLKKCHAGWRIRALENVTLTNPRTGETILRDTPSENRH
ncbi:SgcJ/EcaC family oxidoreductase [Photobacterium sp. 53610]|uniref:SgcJ/EcaC family oxidoreductase n=1 Tax=Photobacterium sp. 53610 TaxID=3102789 RepID=UPI002ED7859E